MTMMNTIDITPTPRILRTLGEIPFQTWQCLAGLIDNSIDAFSLGKGTTADETEKRITINWANDSVAAADRTIEITDNACGMSITQLQNAVRAGYSSNNPVSNLGLFGVGFNIATARLGESTTIMTTRKGDADWVGIKVDFERLTESKSFNAPVVRKAKSNPDESGTKIVIAKLKSGIMAELPNKENEIRQRLESVYAPLLATEGITILVRGKLLKPRNLCVWSESRYVRYGDQNIAARISIDRNLGSALFDARRNCYLTPAEAEDFYISQQEGQSLPDYIIERSKRLTGWLGIQRYADPNDFGIDFIRNGRKILISDKSLFQYENQLTGQKETQYPIELGSTIGGRIVGELHVDYLLPTYQKNDFDRSDISWQQTVEAICGVGPFLPKSRKALGFTEPNVSPLCVLVNAFRRVDKGTKCLFAPNDIAKRYATEFRKGNREYFDDTKWWKAAQEEDQRQSSGGSRATTAVNTGETPSDDVSSYLNGLSGLSPTPSAGSSEATTQTHSQADGRTPSTLPGQSPVLQDSKLDELIQKSNVVNQLTGRNYKYGNTGSLNVRVYELTQGEIIQQGERRPCFFSSDGIDCDFVYDPAHPMLAQYPITPQALLLIYLAEKLKARDNVKDIMAVYSELVVSTMADSKVDRQSLQDRASSVFELLREKLKQALIDVPDDVMNCIHESAGEVEETITNLIQANPSLLQKFQEKQSGGFEAIEFVPPKTLYRLVERFPERTMDGAVFSAPYLAISLTDSNATNRAREESKDRILSFIKDALRMVVGYSQRIPKNELQRASLSVDFLLKELNE